METTPLTQEALRATVPVLEGTVSLKGLGGEVLVHRDSTGVPHIRAESDADAFFAQGFVHAQDRLWHMDYDRRRAQGRWAEWVGTSGVEQDRFMRSLRLGANARADYQGLLPATKAMLDAYAAGVNAFIESTNRLPVEYQLLETQPEPWQPWDGLAVFKVRHVTMGVWEAKLWRGRLLGRIGPEKLAALYPISREGELLIVPPGAFADVDFSAPLEELSGLLPDLTFLSEEGAGSNSWVLSGGRTGTGKPMIAGDPHRAPDVPNVYYQNHLAGATFDVIGLSFPGMPGFPHFGHNDRVAWCVTHAMADTQDLFLERFDPARPRFYQVGGGWQEANVSSERILVRDAEPVDVEVTETRHGPVIAGSTQDGYALALRYIALLPDNRGWDCLPRMMRARSVDELAESMRGWVDPANNFLMADTTGNIGYRTRGQYPVRTELNAWVPVPGWADDHDWRGVLSFEAMPSLKNPVEGYILTANNRIVEPGFPHYLSHWYAADHRAQRIRTHLQEARPFAKEDMVAIQGDSYSRPAILLQPFLAGLHPKTPFAEQAKGALLAWDGKMAADLAAPLIFATAREELIKGILSGVLGTLADEPYRVAGNGPSSVVARLRQRIHEYILADNRLLLGEGQTWNVAFCEALETAVEQLRERLGGDIRTWHWGAVHQLTPSHPLCAWRPEFGRWLNPPATEMAGDGDTVQAAGYHPTSGFSVTLTSVARYFFDLSDWDNSAWVVPFGVSGHPGSPHYADQAEQWRALALAPMPYSWETVARVAKDSQRLLPG